MAKSKEVKPKKERKPRQAKQEQVLPPKILEVNKDATAVSVQEKLTIPTERKKLVPHELVLTVEALLVRVANLEAEVRALKK